MTEMSFRWVYISKYNVFTSFAHFVCIIVGYGRDKEISISHEMEELLEVNLAVAIMIQAHHNLD